MEHLQNRKLKTKVIAPANIYNILREELQKTNKEIILLQDLLNEYSLIEFSEERVKLQIREILLKNKDVKKFTYINDNNFINRLYRLLDDANAKKLSDKDINSLIQKAGLENFELYEHFELVRKQNLETYSSFVNRVKDYILKDITAGNLELTYISDFYTEVEKEFLTALSVKKDSLEKEIFKENVQHPQARYFKNMREEIEWIALNTTNENLSETKLVLADSTYMPFVKSVFARHNIPLTYRETDSTFKYDLQVLLDYIISGRNPEILIENNFFKLETIREIKNFYKISNSNEKIETNESEKPEREFEKFNDLASKYQEFLTKQNNLDEVLSKFEKKINVAKLLNQVNDKIMYSNLESHFKSIIQDKLNDILFTLNITKLDVEVARLLKSKLTNISIKVQQADSSVEVYTIDEISPYKQQAYILGTNISTYPTYKKDYALFEKMYQVLGLDDFEERYKQNIEDLKMHNTTADNVIYTISMNDLKGKEIYQANYDFEIDGLLKEGKEKYNVLTEIQENEYSSGDSDAKYSLKDEESGELSELTKSLYMENLKDLKVKIIKKFLEDKKISEISQSEEKDYLKKLKEKIAEGKNDYYIFNEIVEFYGLEKYKSIKSLEEFLDGGEETLYIRTSVSGLKSYVDSPLTKFIEDITGKTEDLDFASPAIRGTIQHKILEELYKDASFIELIKAGKVKEVEKVIEQVSEREVNEYFKIFNKETSKDIALASFTNNIKGTVASLNGYDKESLKEEQEYSFLVNISKYAKDLNFKKYNFLDLTFDRKEALLEKGIEPEVRINAEDIEVEYSENVFNKYPIFIKGYIDRLIETADKTYLIDYKSSAKSMWLPSEKDRFQQDFLDRIELQLPTYVIARAIEQANSQEEYEEIIEKITAFYVTINSKQSKKKDEFEKNRAIEEISFPILEGKINYKFTVADYYKILAMRINKYILSGRIYKTHKNCIFTNDTFKVNIDSRGKRGEN